MSRKRWITFAVLTLMVLVSGVMTAGCTSAPPESFVKNISAQEAYTLIQDNSDNPDFTVIDVRTPEEYAGGHIENALNINYQSGTFREDIGKLDRDKTYLVHCRSGARSAGALGVMKELEFTSIYHMNGGIMEWTEEELPLEE